MTYLSQPNVVLIINYDNPINLGNFFHHIKIFYIMQISQFFSHFPICFKIYISRSYIYHVLFLLLQYFNLIQFLQKVEKCLHTFHTSSKSSLIFSHFLKSFMLSNLLSLFTLFETCKYIFKLDASQQIPSSTF